jgi:hypothetical protein
MHEGRDEALEASCPFLACPQTSLTVVLAGVGVVVVDVAVKPGLLLGPEDADAAPDEALAGHGRAALAGLGVVVGRRRGRGRCGRRGRRRGRGRRGRRGGRGRRRGRGRGRGGRCGRGRGSRGGRRLGALAVGGGARVFALVRLLGGCGRGIGRGATRGRGRGRGRRRRGAGRVRGSAAAAPLAPRAALTTPAAAPRGCAGRLPHAAGAAPRPGRGARRGAHRRTHRPCPRRRACPRASGRPRRSWKCCAASPRPPTRASWLSSWAGGRSGRARV